MLVLVFTLLVLISSHSKEDEKNNERSKHMCPGDTLDSHCGGQGTCFFGKCFCYPGWQGSTCKEVLRPANPWYTKDCPNLQAGTKTTFGSWWQQEEEGEEECKEEVTALSACAACIAVAILV